MHDQTREAYPAYSSWPRLLLALAAAVLLSPATVLAHPGPLDDNGGHYDRSGASYHCHMSVCQQPDTFTRGSRDSFFFDPDSRSRFFNEADWPLFDGDRDNCRSTRQTILVLTSRQPVSFTNPRECEVRVGDWVDEYTGERYNVANQLELDHIIPRRYAHNHGGDRWPPGKKYAFANDPQNLILVARDQVGRKNDRGPSGFMPREEYHCEYAQQWQAISDKYELRLNNRDRNRIRSILEDCGEGTDAAPVDE